ncbi:MAG: hypothetical protein IJI58_00845 [Bacilli bacterium]|nr:hypothetical protein [Bacilli bacterium]
MNEETTRFLNVLNLKKRLINFSTSTLREIYKDDYDSYLLFLDSVRLLINNETAFLLLNNEEYIDKILSVISIHGFDDTNPKVKKLVNQIADACDEIVTMSEGDKYAYRYNYIVEQEELREVRFCEEEELITALNFDSFLVSILQNDEKEYLYACDNMETIMSLNYIKKKCPSFFDDEKVQINVQDKLDHMTSELKKERIDRRTVAIYVDELCQKIKKLTRGKE